MTTEPWVTLQDVAEHLKVSQDTIHRWMTRRSLPAHRAGHYWRFKLSEVDEWVRSGKGGESEDITTGEQP